MRCGSASSACSAGFATLSALVAATVVCMFCRFPSSLFSCLDRPLANRSDFFQKSTSRRRTRRRRRLLFRVRFRLPADAPNLSHRVEQGRQACSHPDFPSMSPAENRQNCSLPQVPKNAASTRRCDHDKRGKTVALRKTGRRRRSALSLERPPPFGRPPSFLRLIKAGSPGEIKLPVNEILSRRAACAAATAAPHFVRLD